MSGKKQWYIVDGYRPSPKPDPNADYSGHESVMILNTNDKDANVLISIYFEDREPVENISYTPFRQNAYAALKPTKKKFWVLKSEWVFNIQWKLKATSELSCNTDVLMFSSRIWHIWH